VFKGDSADTCARKFPLMSKGGRANGQACADGEQVPPSARAEVCKKGPSVTIRLDQYRSSQYK
jgi:hypothetical protein